MFLGFKETKLTLRIRVSVILQNQLRQNSTKSLLLRCPELAKACSFVFIPKDGKEESMIKKYRKQKRNAQTSRTQIIRIQGKRRGKGNGFSVVREGLLKNTAKA